MVAAALVPSVLGLPEEALDNDDGHYIWLRAQRQESIPWARNTELSGLARQKYVDLWDCADEVSLMVNGH